VFKILVSIALLSSAVGCSHVSSSDRSSDYRRPSQASDITLLGRVGYSESKVSAGYTGDSGEPELFYTVQVDCDGDRILSREEQGRIIKISASSVSATEKKKFANFKKRAERQNKDGNAKPYVNVTMTPNFSERQVCEGSPIGKVYTASNARFTTSWKK
jgi:hypothetical protein